ncbi:glycerol-3-phosphate responsive antiterminator [Acetivibrio sp. MSJd-27]|jgi:glycerol uptake operon antiterminator|uniref:glycerol-3-phosphate responsive antiterminator n=1 Tax=Acetivibrio sp. MSJd-27 TaxID=2841523 RepID=UPI001C0FCDAF|nr:glycerol-3-phosphate responsive antiterminator [Acetivibrio sp. MSJd-27]MBU5449200.1 glycerol-3-phosphate responsive antiterminator [Acetivibrio sp. MSJd-27]
MNGVISRIEENPIIAAVRDPKKWKAAVCSSVQAVFLLCGDIFHMRDLVETVQSEGKLAFLHIDFLEGLGRDKKAIEYLAKEIKPDGIISTRTNHIKYAKEAGILTVQRFFIVDSISYRSSVETARSVRPDMVEIMPAVMPKVIHNIAGDLNMHVIAGGLIDTKEEIMEILAAGAFAVSTGKEALWDL